MWIEERRDRSRVDGLDGEVGQAFSDRQTLYLPMALRATAKHKQRIAVGEEARDVHVQGDGRCALLPHLHRKSDRTCPVALIAAGVYAELIRGRALPRRLRIEAAVEQQEPVHGGPSPVHALAEVQR